MTRHDHVIDFIEFPAGDVGQLDRGKRFFADVFGWTYRDWGEDDIQIRRQWRHERQQCRSRASTTAPARRDPRDLDTRSRVIAAGGEIRRETFVFPGGRRFHFRDPAGNELAVWSEH